MSGLAPLGYYLHERLVAAEVAGYRQTRAVVTESRQVVSPPLDSNDDSMESTVVHVAFRYEVDGQFRDGDGVYCGDPTPTVTVNAPSVLPDYPVGRETVAYYDPRNPSTVCLRQGYTGGTVVLAWFGGGLWALGLVFLLWGTGYQPGLLRVLKR